MRPEQSAQGFGNDRKLKLYVTLACRAPDGILAEPLLWPEQLGDGIGKRLDAAFDRRIAVEDAQRIIVQQRRGRPDTDERGDAVITRPAALHVEFFCLLGIGIPNVYIADRGQILIRLGGERIPDVAAHGIGAAGARRVGAYISDRIARVAGEEVVITKI